jgi:signal transduction histidine kinase/DNA-binding NarL/FixJ family response regulator
VLELKPSELEFSRVAAVIAGARDSSDLLARLAELLGGATASVRLRLWLLGSGSLLQEAAREPAGTTLPRVDRERLVEAVSTHEPLKHGRALLIGLSNDRAHVGVIELRPPGVPGAELLQKASEVIAARAQQFLPGENQSPFSRVPLTDVVGEIQEVVSAFAAQAKRLLDHDRLSIYLLTPDSTALERFAVATSPIIPGEGDVIALEDVGLARVIRENRAIVSADFGTDKRIIGHEDSIIAEAGFHGLVSVPLRLGDRPFGLLNFVSRKIGFYSPKDVVVAQQIADQVAVFLQNLRLQHAVHVAVQREAIERERNRVARELHDTLAQTLADISVKAQVLAKNLESLDSPSYEHAVVLQESARGALEGVRRSLLDMIPSELEENAVDQVIQQLLAGLGREEGITTKFELRGDIAALSGEVQTAAFRIVQEALTNIRKHAGASNVAVQLQVDEGLVMKIRDDGSGFSNTALQQTAAGLGLRSMRDRAEAIDGHLIVTSSPGEGTKVCLNVPNASRSAESSNVARRPQPRVPPRTVIRVLVVDDHPVFREGLANLLEFEEDLRVVGQAATGQEALAAVDLLRPDVVLLDLELPDCSGIDIAAQLGADSEPAVLIMSAFAEGNHVADALEAGVSGYIAKTTSGAPLVDAIRAAARGSRIFSPEIHSQLHAQRSELTPRELQILKLIVSGLTNAGIAHQLHLAPKTVERIVATVIFKLGAKNRAHAAAKAVAQKLIDARTV